MKLESFDEALKELKKGPTRKFSQSLDLIVTLRDMNLKNPEEQVDFFTNVSKPFKKKKKVAALVGIELKEKAEGVVDLVIPEQDFQKYTDKKLLKKLANEYDYFIAQADIMPKIATVFGRALGPRGKMPNPKLGSILPSKASVEPIYEKLQTTVRVSARKALNIQVKIGEEDMDAKALKENFENMMSQIINHLPKGRSNVNKTFLKLTMSKPVEINV